MKGHFIVCGLGHIGYRIAQLLQRLGQGVTVVTQEARAEWKEAVEKRGGSVLIGDARDVRLIESAGIASADAIIAATDADLVNIEIALDARELRPDLPIVVRLFDQILAQRLEESLDFRRAFATSTLAAPSFAAAILGEHVLSSFSIGGTSYIVAQLTADPDSGLPGRKLESLNRDAPVAVLTHQRQGEAATLAPAAEMPIETGDVITVVTSASNWHEMNPHVTEEGDSARAERWNRFRPKIQPVQWARAVRRLWLTAPPPLRSFFITVNLIIVSSVFFFQIAMNLSLVDAVYFVTTTVATVGYGDITPLNAAPVVKIFVSILMLLSMVMIAVLYSVITDFLVMTRFEQILGSQTVPTEGHVIVVGLGNFGYRVVEELRRAGLRVSVVEKQMSSDFVEVVRTSAPVLIGDGRTRDILLRAGAGAARAVIAGTSDDAVNLSVALAAKQIRPSVRTIVRFFDADFAGKVQKALNVDGAMSPAAIAAPAFVAAALHERVRSAFVYNRYLISLIQQTAGERWAGLTPAHLRQEQNLIVLLAKDANEQSFRTADPDRVLRASDELLAVVFQKLGLER